MCALRGDSSERSQHWVTETLLRDGFTDIADIRAAHPTAVDWAWYCWQRKFPAEFMKHTARILYSSGDDFPPEDLFHAAKPDSPPMEKPGPQKEDALLELRKAVQRRKLFPALEAEQDLLFCAAVGGHTNAVLELLRRQQPWQP
eukprot:RCo033709